MDRFYLPPSDWSAESLRLTGEEGHHAVRVMRKKEGDRIELFDGAGRWARGPVVATERGGLTMEIAEEGRSPDSGNAIVLAVAMTKGKTMDLIVQKAVELGVSRIEPLSTRNTVVKISDSDREGKSAKWQRVALEACKQCGQNHLPQVAPVSDLSVYLAREREGVSYLASLAPGAKGLRERLSASPASSVVNLLIGPEGDFTAEETAAGVSSGFEPVTLGNIVLRVETACLYLISAVRYQFGE